MIANTLADKAFEFWYALARNVRCKWWALVLVTITGCAGIPTDSVEPVPLLLPPSSYGGTLSLSQFVVGEYGDQKTSMRFEIDISPDRLIIVALSPEGVTLFTLEHDGGEPVINAITADEKAIDPRFILFDLYLTYWPTRVLRNALKEQGLELQEDPHDNIRTVMSSMGAKLAKVMYSDPQTKNTEIIIQHYDLPYRLRIKPLKEASAQ